MRRASLVLSAFLWLAATFTNAEQPSYLKDLEEQGYCVVEGVLSASEARVLYERVWHEFIEKAWPNCRMDDRSNWEEAFPKHNKEGVFSGPAGQIQVMWDLRQDPRIVDVFANLWNTSELSVSMDGLSLMCPPEIREGYVEPWPHVDQERSIVEFVGKSSLKTDPFSVQGQFLFEDSFEDDGGFYCIPKSHRRFDEFVPQIAVIYAMPPGNERRGARKALFQEFFGNSTDESGNPYCMKHITAPRGSLILWDSRTIHWNQHATSNRPYSASPKVRMVGYLCYIPKTRLTDGDKAIRKEAFETGASTGHYGTSIQRRKDESLPEFKQYLEDPSYTQPEIKLSPLGESLLGL